MNSISKIVLTSALVSPLLFSHGSVLANDLPTVDLTAVPAGNYQSDSIHSYIHFTYNHLGLSNPVLAFDDFTIDMELDAENVENTTIDMTIDPSSIVAGSEIWQQELIGAEFFDVENHPDITFQSSAVSASDDGTYTVDGDLTIKGESSPVTLNVTLNAATEHPMSGNPVIGIAGSGSVLRSDYGLDKFAPNVSDQVNISLTAEMVKAQ